MYLVLLNVCFICFDDMWHVNKTNTNLLTYVLTYFLLTVTDADDEEMQRM